jgi:filamentous hemagglutinin family protein
MTRDRMVPALASSARIGSRTLTRSSAVLAVAMASSMLTPLGGLAGELPTGANVVSGSVAVGAPAANVMNITQGSDRAVVNWNSFSIGSGARVDIAQPDAGSALLNRVTGDTTSAIHGQLNANGQVYLVNPNGIFIGPNGAINTGGFVASTLGISTQDFERGRLRFVGDGASATVVNEGVINSVRGGYAALIGGQVHNAGVIRVPMGKVGLGAGERVTLDLAGDGFMQVALPSNSDDDALDALVTNSGVIEANGGRVELLAATARNAARHAINMSGVIEARSVGGRSGAIVLGGGSGGAVNVSGRMDVSARATAVETSPRPVQRGGDITVTGSDIALNGAVLDASGSSDGGVIRIGGDYQGQGDLQRALTAHVDAATRLLADAGDVGTGGRVIVWSDDFTEFDGQISARGGQISGDGGFAEVSGKIDLRYRGFADLRTTDGTWGTLLLDPTNITVPGTVDEATVEAALEGGFLHLNTSDVPGSDAGDITIDATIDWASTGLFVLTADNDIVLNGAINGPSGALTLDALGTITTGPGGAVDVSEFDLFSGDWMQVGASLPDFYAADFNMSSCCASFLRAQGGDGSTASPFQIFDVFGLQGLDSSLSTSNFVLANNIDASETEFWDFDGEGTYFGFDPIAPLGGMFDGQGYAVDGLTVNRSGSSGGLFSGVGSAGTVTNLSVTNASIRSLSGGIIAGFNDGMISNTRVTGSVIAGGDSGAGGLVAFNFGTIQDSISEAMVDASFVPFEGFGFDVGGLVGLNSGSGVIQRSHATGNVVASDSSDGGPTMSVGGFVGDNGGTIENAYSLGNAAASTDMGSADVGGFVGYNDGDITYAFSTGVPSFTGSGSSAVGGFAGTDISVATISASFWDTVSSGLATSAAGVGLTTAELQNTQQFFDNAGALGWDFDMVWAPGQTGFYPALYSTSPVLFAQPMDFSVQYGLTDSATTTGSISGGPMDYVFGPMGDTLDTSAVLTDLTVSDPNVGDQPFVLNTTGLTSGMGQDYRVVSLSGVASVTEAPLTITALDQSKTYGEELIFDGTEFDVIGLVFADSVDSATIDSTGAPATATVSMSGAPITISDAMGTGLSNYAIQYVPGTLTILPAALTITALNQSKLQGEDFVFDGTEFSVAGLVSGDAVTSTTLFSLGADEDATAAGSPYPIDVSDAVGSGLANYSIAYVPGEFVVGAGVVPPPPPPEVLGVANPTDTVTGGTDDGGTIQVKTGTQVEAAEKTLNITKNASNALQVAAASCAQNGDDVSRYLACLADALDSYADDLDALAKDLPPGLESVGDIIQGAKQEILVARASAERQLATATTDAQRRAIRNAAIGEAQTSLNNAKSEIRKAISLIRAEDPELVSLQTETVETIVSAVDNVSIGLSRVVEL